MKRILLLSLSFLCVLTLNSCITESEPNIHVLINELNQIGNYNISINDFNVETNESIVYRTMFNSETLLSVYCNKESEIIQCTLSSFDIKNKINSDLFINISTILTKQEKKQIEAMLKNAEQTGSFSNDGWNITIIENNLGIVYIVNRTSEPINVNNMPTLKRKIND